MQKRVPDQLRHTIITIRSLYNDMKDTDNVRPLLEWLCRVPKWSTKQILPYPNYNITALYRDLLYWQHFICWLSACDLVLK